MTQFQFPIRGLVAKRGEFTVRYNKDEAMYEVWRGDRCCEGSSRYTRALERMLYRFEMAQGEGEALTALGYK